MNKDWAFADDKYTCELRTAGVLIKNNMILVQRDKDRNEYALPGGHIKIGETLEDDLVREMMEEMGINLEYVQSKRMFLGMERQASAYYRFLLSDRAL